MADLAGIIAQIAAEMADAPDRGQVADYIPALAKVSPAHFGMAVVLVAALAIPIIAAQRFLERERAV